MYNKYRFTNGLVGFGLEATSLVGALAETVAKNGVAVELALDSDEFTAYGIMADRKYAVYAPSMMDAEMYVSHVLMECVSAVWEMEEGEAQTVHKSMTFTFSITELLEAFRD